MLFRPGELPHQWNIVAIPAASDFHPCRWPPGLLQHQRDINAIARAHRINIGGRRNRAAMGVVRHCRWAPKVRTARRAWSRLLWPTRLPRCRTARIRNPACLPALIPGEFPREWLSGGCSLRRRRRDRVSGRGERQVGALSDRDVSQGARGHFLDGAGVRSASWIFRT
jgi:hypothetical protein